MKRTVFTIVAVSLAAASSPAGVRAEPALPAVAQFLTQARQGAAPVIQTAGPAGQDGTIIGNLTEAQYIELLQRLRTEPERYNAVMAVPDSGFAKLSGPGLEWFLYLTDRSRAAAILARVPAATWERFTFSDYRRLLSRLADDQWLAVWSGKIPAGVWREVTLQQYHAAITAPRPTLRAIDATPAAYWTRLTAAELSRHMAWFPEEQAALLAAWTRAQTR